MTGYFHTEFDFENAKETDKTVKIVGKYHEPRRAEKPGRPGIVAQLGHQRCMVGFGIAHASPDCFRDFS